MPFSKLLVPVDFSTHADVALALAIDVAKQSNAALLLLHVHAIPIIALPDGQVTFSAEQNAEITEKLKAALAKVEADARARGVAKVEGVLVDGTPADAILEVAKTRGVDLIVMATHGRTGLSHVLIGSVAERVVRLASCPVMTVRTPTTK